MLPLLMTVKAGLLWLAGWAAGIPLYIMAGVGLTAGIRLGNHILNKMDERMKNSVWFANRAARREERQIAKAQAAVMATEEVVTINA